MYKISKTQYTIQTIMSVQVWHVQIWNEKNVYLWWINNWIISVVNKYSAVCFTFNVKCSWDGLPEANWNCSCVWSFWCSELCSVDQTVYSWCTVSTLLDARGPEWFCQPFFSLWISTVLGEGGGLYQCFAQQSGLPSVVFWGQIW